jgi:hypothetical protein
LDEIGRPIATPAGTIVFEAKSCMGDNYIRTITEGMSPPILFDENMQAVSGLGSDFVARVAWLESNRNVPYFPPS